MREGDLVRFAKWGEFPPDSDWSKAAKSHVGILVEHDKLMGIACVLYKGEVLRVRHALVEKAGKKDEGR